MLKVSLLMCFHALSSFWCSVTYSMWPRNTAAVLAVTGCEYKLICSGCSATLCSCKLTYCIFVFLLWPEKHHRVSSSVLPFMSWSFPQPFCLTFQVVHHSHHVPSILLVRGSQHSLCVPHSHQSLHRHHCNCCHLPSPALWAWQGQFDSWCDNITSCSGPNIFWGLNP